MRRKILIFSLIALVLTMSSFLMMAFTFGWLAPLVTISDNDIAVGDLRYTKSGAFIAPATIIIPGDELLASTISITNSSPIDSQLRVKIEYTTWTNIDDVITEGSAFYKGGAAEPLKAEFAAGFVCVGDYWYLYDTGVEVIYGPDSGAQDLVTSIYYDGDYTGIDYSGRNVTVTVSIEVKQADNVAWSELATYDFSTGYPA